MLAMIGDAQHSELDRPEKYGRPSAVGEPGSPRTEVYVLELLAS